MINILFKILMGEKNAGRSIDASHASILRSYYYLFILSAPALLWGGIASTASSLSLLATLDFVLFTALINLIGITALPLVISYFPPRPLKDKDLARFIILYNYLQSLFTVLTFVVSLIFVALAQGPAEENTPSPSSLAVIVFVTLLNLAATFRLLRSLFGATRVQAIGLICQTFGFLFFLLLGFIFIRLLITP
jgi:hypothetical protein